MRARHVGVSYLINIKDPSWPFWQKRNSNDQIIKSYFYMTFQNIRMLDESDAISDGRARTRYDIGSSPCTKTASIKISDSDKVMFKNLGRGLRVWVSDSEKLGTVRFWQQKNLLGMSHVERNISHLACFVSSVVSMMRVSSFCSFCNVYTSQNDRHNIVRKSNITLKTSIKAWFQ